MNQHIANVANGSTALSTETNFFTAYGEAQSSKAIVGDLLKFAKGEWLYGMDGHEMAEGTQLAANMDELLIGWVRWENGAPTEHVMGRVVEGFQPPKRKELGDTDETEWEKDKDGKPRDPWQFTNYLLLKDLDGDKLFTFTTSSRGGLNAIGSLCKVFGKEMRTRQGEWPVVALGVDSYKHRDKSYGKIFTPLLNVVGWAPKGEFGAAMAAAEAEEDAEATVKNSPEEAAAPASRSTKKAAATNAPRF